jgi:metal iron transporter
LYSNCHSHIYQPIMRRVVTRAIGLVPSMAVAIAAGRNGVNTMLVASQVALAIVLPFIVFPLLYLTSSREIMSVKKPLAAQTDTETNNKAMLQRGSSELGVASSAESVDTTSLADLEGAVETVDYSNSKVVIVLGWLLWLVVLAANVYAIISLGLGQS